jgi:hypothetical protein
LYNLLFFNQFGKEKHFFYGPVPKGYTTKQIDKDYIKKNNDTIVVLIGHSAVRYINHKETLDSLKHLIKKPIHLIIPLNYGDQNYANTIKEYANRTFPGHCSFIERRLSLDEYIRLLWTVDVGIIDSERQIAMGNITLLFYMGAKVFLKKNTVMFDYYHDKELLDVFDCDSIPEMSFETFSSPINSCGKNVNKRFAEKELKMDEIKTDWKNIFLDLEKR